MKKDEHDFVETRAFQAGQRAAFVAAIEECEEYAKTIGPSESKAVALQIAVRITQRAKKGMAE